MVGSGGDTEPASLILGGPGACPRIGPHHSDVVVIGTVLVVGAGFSP
jgi:hypothetical protein